MTLRKYKSSCNFQFARFLGPNVWALVPQNIKNCKSLPEFKTLAFAECAKSTLQKLHLFD